MAKDPRADRLRRAIDNAGLGGGASAVASIDLTPKSAHEALTRQMVTDLGGDLDEVKGRVNALIGVVLGAVLLDVVMRIVGAG